MLRIGGRRRGFPQSVRALRSHAERGNEECLLHTAEMLPDMLFYAGRSNTIIIMSTPISLRAALAATAVVVFVPAGRPSAAEMTVELGGNRAASFVGAVRRWDQDGNHRRLPDGKEKIDAPPVDAQALRSSPGRWVFAKLPPGRYDLVILAKDRLRVEGFTFPPVKDFDPFLSPEDAVDRRTRRTIVEKIKKSRHYENKVEPLYLAGDEKTVRALVMLIRDKPTSYEAEFPGAATIRHEIWQFAWRYGGWTKEKRTKLLDRVLLDRDELRKWTWLWDHRLGGVEVADRPVKIEYDLPDPAKRRLRGLYPCKK